MLRQTFVLLATTLALQACVGVPTPTRPLPSLQSALNPAQNAAPTGRGVALLAPLTGPNAERGQAMVRAAQLALADPGSPKLDVRDTSGTPAGAAAAARDAIAAGAGLIIGPLTAAETAAAAGPARAANIPVLAFTSDPSQARPGVWTLGITPAQQVGRLVGALAAQGKTRFAAVLPSNDFGNAMAAALGQATASAGLPAPEIRTYQSGMASLNATVRDISNYPARRGPLEAQIKAARDQRDADGRRRAADLSRQGTSSPPFDAILLAETGETLSSLASVLPFYDIEPPAVRIIGPALWASPAARGGAALDGAYYAAPDPASRSDFDTRYTAANAAAAPGIADFAYDAAAIARVLAQADGYSVAALCRPEGYAGVDGVLTLLPDGRVRRGLALFEIQRGGPVMIEPSPASLTAPAS